MLTPSQNQRLAAAAAAACLCEEATRLPAELTVAQWALESGWGLDAPGNNCFGIKAFKGCRTQLLLTKECIDGEMQDRQLEFAAFDSLADCFECHALLIIHGKSYAQAWAQYQVDRDLQALIAGVAHAYATDPGYADKLRRIIAMPQVQSALGLVRGDAHA